MKHTQRLIRHVLLDYATTVDHHPYDKHRFNYVLSKQSFNNSVVFVCIIKCIYIKHYPDTVMGMQFKYYSALFKNVSPPCYNSLLPRVFTKRDDKCSSSQTKANIWSLHSKAAVLPLILYGTCTYTVCFK